VETCAAGGTLATLEEAAAGEARVDEAPAPPVERCSVLELAAEPQPHAAQLSATSSTGKRAGFTDAISSSAVSAS
jgi:hypothetical protein